MFTTYNKQSETNKFINISTTVVWLLQGIIGFNDLRSTWLLVTYSYIITISYCKHECVKNKFCLTKR